MFKILLLFIIINRLNASDINDFTVDMKDNLPVFGVNGNAYENVDKAILDFKKLSIDNHQINSVNLVILNALAKPYAINSGARFSLNENGLEPFYVISIQGGPSCQMSIEESREMVNSDIPLRTMEILGASHEIIEKLRNK